MKASMKVDLGEKHGELWMLAAAPAAWAVHFLLCYGTAAIWCAKLAAPNGSLIPVRYAIAGYTAVALAAIGSIGYVGLRRHSLGSEALPHDADTPEDRHRFLGFATLLLSGLSAVAVVYAGLVAALIGSCE